MQKTFSIQQIRVNFKLKLWDHFEINFSSSSLSVVITDASKGLRNLTLSVYPEVIRRGQSAQLHCNYEVLDPSILLYSVKYYRGIFEFYRYTPFEHPPQKTFFFNTGIKVDVSINFCSIIIVCMAIIVGFLFAYFITNY